jgi:transposase-like protein
LSFRKQTKVNGGNAKNPPKLNPEQKEEILKKVAEGRGDSEIAREYGVSRNAIFNLRKKQPK